MKFFTYSAIIFTLFSSPIVQADESRALTLATAAPDQSEQKLALVIGNADYQSSPLKNPVNDARAMSAKLEQLGFEIIKYENLKQKQLGMVLRTFRSKLQPGAVAVFFYAGHGLQIKGVNYLPTVDADIVSEDDVSIQSLDLNKIFDVMTEGKTRLNLVFLDACRNNPYSRSFRSLSDGLAKVDAPSGTLISFATRPGSVARDGDGNNGLYTQHLLDAIDAPGLTVEQALKRVVRNVKLASKGTQEPWIEGSIDGEFHFRAPSIVENIPDESVELAFWATIKDSTLRADFDTYLTRYAAGKFVAQAKEARGRLIEAELKESKRREEEMRKLALMQQKMEEDRLKRETERQEANRREEVEAKRRDEEVRKLVLEKQKLEQDNLARDAERQEAKHREELEAKRRDDELKKLAQEKQKLEQERLARETELGKRIDEQEAKHREDEVKKLVLEKQKLEKENIAREAERQETKRQEAIEAKRHDEEMKQLVLKQEKLEKENLAREAERQEAKRREEIEAKHRDNEMKKLAQEKKNLEEENRRIQAKAQEVSEDAIAKAVDAELAKKKKGVKVVVTPAL